MPCLALYVLFSGVLGNEHTLTLLTRDGVCHSVYRRCLCSTSTLKLALFQDPAPTPMSLNKGHASRCVLPASPVNFCIVRQPSSASYFLSPVDTMNSQRAASFDSRSHSPSESPSRYSQPTPLNHWMDNRQAPGPTTSVLSQKRPLNAQAAHTFLGAKSRRVGEVRHGLFER